MDVTKIEETADAVEHAWTEYADEVIIEAAEDAVRELRRLARLIRSVR
jgi:hypothetical protein